MSNVTAKMIHQDFDTAVEVAIKIPADIARKRKAKYDNLNKAGFWYAAATKSLSDAINLEQISIEEHNFYRYYRVWYPFNKYITQGMVGVLCKKYSLVHGSVNIYIGDIPEKNIDEISSFTLREEESFKYKNESRNRFGGAKFWGCTINGSYHERPENESFYHCRKKMTICAPQKDFMTDNMTIAPDGYTLIDIKDPIVLQEVPGGYLIVSKWGDEASDELVVNQIDN